MIVIDIMAIECDNSTPLIVCSNTGVSYDVQVGGIACNHPNIEGFVLNMPSMLSELNMCSYGCSYIQDMPDQQKKLADDIQKTLITYCIGYVFKVEFDYDRLKLLQEGLVPVVLSGRYFDTDLTGMKGFLYTGNCD